MTSHTGTEAKPPGTGDVSLVFVVAMMTLIPTITGVSRELRALLNPRHSVCTRIRWTSNHYANSLDDVLDRLDQGDAVNLIGLPYAKALTWQTLTATNRLHCTVPDDRAGSSFTTSP